MSSLMLVNPSGRRKSRSPAQKRATRALVAFNRSRKRGTSVTRHRPKRRAVVTRTSRTTITRRRNPIGRKSGIVNELVMPSVMGTGGAVALDVAFHFLPLPTMLKTGAAHIAAKGAAAVLLGMLAGKVMKKSTANEIARGALTVTMHQAAVGAIGHFLPNFALGDAGTDYGLTDAMGYYSPALVEDGSGVGFYPDEGIVPGASNVLSGADELDM